MYLFFQRRGKREVLVLIVGSSCMLVVGRSGPRRQDNISSWPMDGFLLLPPPPTPTLTCTQCVFARRCGNMRGLNDVDVGDTDTCVTVQ